MNEAPSWSQEVAARRETSGPIRIAYEYVALILGLGLLGLLCVTWSIIALPLAFLPPSNWARKLGRRAISHGFRFYLHCLSIPEWIKLELDPMDNLKRGAPVVLAPNHPGLLDAVLVLSRFENLGCVVKADLLNHPLLGAGARLAGYIPNDRRHRMIHSAIEELRKGHHLLLFPEGTRTTHMPVNPFKSSPGLIASKAGASVQTIFIETNSRFLGKGWPLLRRPDLPIEIKVRLGRCFPPPSDVRTFTTELENYFASELQQGSASGQN